MTPIDILLVNRGIPPDPDHLLLMRCCYGDCLVTDRDEPLVVTGCVGKMATFCKVHLSLLREEKPVEPEYGPSGGELER